MPLVSAFHKESVGIPLSKVICSFDTGWTNDMLWARSEMLPSALLRRAPYFKSPFIGIPAFDN